MLIESKIKIGQGIMFNIRQTNFKSAHLLNEMALVQFQRKSTVIGKCSVVAVRHTLDLTLLLLL